MHIIAKLFKKNKKQSPRTAPRKISLFEAMDRSMAAGFYAVNWQAVNWEVA